MLLCVLLHCVHNQTKYNDIINIIKLLMIFFSPSTCAGRKQIDLLFSIGDKISILMIFSFPAVIVRWDFLAFTVRKTSMSAPLALATTLLFVKTL